MGALRTKEGIAALPLNISLFSTFLEVEMDRWNTCMRVCVRMLKVQLERQFVPRSSKTFGYFLTLHVKNLHSQIFKKFARSSKAIEMLLSYSF